MRDDLLDTVSRQAMGEHIVFFFVSFWRDDCFGRSPRDTLRNNASPGLCKSDKVDPIGQGLAEGFERRLDTSVLSRLVPS